MRKHARPQSDIQVPALHEAIVEAAQKGVDWDHVQALVHTLGEKGLIDPAGAWDSAGRTLLGALMRARTGYGAVVPQSLLELAMELDPAALTRKDSGNNTPVDYFLDALDEDDKNLALWTAAKWWLNNAPKSLLLDWVPTDRYGDGMKPEPNGYHLLNTVLDSEKNLDRADYTLLSDLSRLGVDMNACSHKGYSPANKIKHDIQWETYLALGGSPTAMVGNSNADKPPVPLWQYLVDCTYDSASKAATAWAKEHVGDTMKQKLYDEYWQLLNEKTKYSPSPAAIPSIVRSHDDYLTLRDKNGRTAAMYVIRMHGSAFKTLQQKQYQSMNKERDNDGYSLWHYALSKGKTLSVEAMRSLLDTGAPLDPNPKTGRGLFPSLLIDFPHQSSIYERYPRDVQGLDRVLKKTTGEQWWAMNEGDWDLMEKNLDEVLRTKDSSVGLVYIACQFIDHIPNAAMRDKLMAANLDSYGSRINAQGVVKYFELGYADQWEADKVERLKNKLDAESFARVQSVYQARQLDQAAPAVSEARKGPRL